MASAFWVPETPSMTMVVWSMESEAGTERSSRASTSRRVADGRRRAGSGPGFVAANGLRNDMGFCLSKAGLRYSETPLGAQTGRRGGAGPVGSLLGGYSPPAAFTLESNRSDKSGYFF